MKKLDAKGFSHDILLVVIVVMVSIVGVGLIVASHADTGCPSPSNAVSSATSGLVSGSAKAKAAAKKALKQQAACQVSQPVSDIPEPGQPVETPPEAYAPLPDAAIAVIPDAPTASEPDMSLVASQTPPTAKCKISGVPSRPRHSQIIHPIATITNTSTVALNAHGTLGMKTFDKQGHAVVNRGAAFNITNLQPRKKKQIALSQYVVGYSRTNKVKGSFSVVSKGTVKFVCKTTFAFPKYPTKK